MNNRMNRKERRAARDGGMLVITGGYLLPHDLNYELPVECYVCGAAHKAHGLVRIEDGRSVTDAPICASCVADDPDEEIARKFLNAPDLKIRDATPTEQFDVLAGKPAMTKH